MLHSRSFFQLAARLGIAAVLSILLLSQCIMADVRVEGWEQVDYKYIISNIKDFPQYLFLTSSAIWGWEYASVIDSTGEFGGGYKLDSFIVNSIKRSNLDAERLVDESGSDDGGSDDLLTFNCTNYCQDNSNIVSSDLSLPKATSVEESQGVDGIEVDIRIDEITDQNLKLSKVRMVYYYQNGTTQEVSPELL
jgi:hypothetical protein